MVIELYVEKKNISQTHDQCFYIHLRNTSGENLDDLYQHAARL